jgi:hypothetical protein
VISTIDGVRGITARKLTRIDSLTASIRCTSSMTTTVGSVPASIAALISAVSRRRLIDLLGGIESSASSSTQLFWRPPWW